MGNDWSRVEPAGVQQTGHLVPGAEHLSAIDADDPATLKDQGVKINFYFSVSGQAEGREATAFAQDFDPLIDRARVPGHLQDNVRADTVSRFFYFVDQLRVIVFNKFG